MKKEQINLRDADIAMIVLSGAKVVEIVDDAGTVLASIEVFRPDMVDAFGQESIAYLNEKTSSRYKYDGKNRTLLRALSRSGYDLDDVVIVVDKKYADWSGKVVNGVNMLEYMRPSTLFNKQKFEEYLQSAKMTGKSSDANSGYWENNR